MEQSNIPLKKQWKKPEFYLLSSVEGGSNPNVHESTAVTSIGGAAGPGNPGQKAYNVPGSKFVPNWTQASAS